VERGIKMKFCVEIQRKDGKCRRIPLDHEYKNRKEAESEAEDLVDQIYTNNDISWSIEIDGI
jgi:tRNA(His) 5'-end guanylyltransferase